MRETAQRQKHSDPYHCPLFEVALNYPAAIAAFQLSPRAATAAGLAVAIAHLLRLQYPLYPLIAAVLVTDLSPLKTRKLGFPRLVGAALGAMLGATVGSLVQAGAWVLGLGIFAGMFLSQVLRLQNAAKVPAAQSRP